MKSKVTAALFFLINFLAALGLCCGSWAFSSCGVQTSHCSGSLGVEHGFWGMRASVAATQGFCCFMAKLPVAFVVKTVLIF